MIKRKLFITLLNHLSKKEITFIVGPRQAGKTTLMEMLREIIMAERKRTLFLNFDIEADKQYVTSQAQLLKKIELEIGETGFVFIDEIQRKENAGLFLKGIYDMNLPYKFIVSGSGSVELKEKIHESLAGRKRIFTLPTLSFIEFVNFKTDYRYENKLADFFDLSSDQLQGYLEEYLSFGGYPRVVLAETIAEKRKVIAELYQSYLERDIISLLGVQKSERFTYLVRLMASQIGQMVNISELSRTLGVNSRTVNAYLWYLQNTLLINKVTPFFRNVRKEISKSPIYYFDDLGMRNYALGIFGSTIPLSEVGFLFQNLIFNFLKEQARDKPYKIHYWRTTDKAEVDFIYDKVREIIPLEVKYKTLTHPQMTRSFQNFLSRYHPQKGYIVHLGAAMQKEVQDTNIFFIPFQDLLFKKI